MKARGVLVEIANFGSNECRIELRPFQKLEARQQAGVGGFADLQSFPVGKLAIEFVPDSRSRPDRAAEPW